MLASSGMSSEPLPRSRGFEAETPGLSRWRQDSGASTANVPRGVRHSKDRRPGPPSARSAASRRRRAPRRRAASARGGSARPRRRFARARAAKAARASASGSAREAAGRRAPGAAARGAATQGERDEGQRRGEPRGRARRGRPRGGARPAGAGARGRSADPPPARARRLGAAPVSSRAPSKLPEPREVDERAAPSAVRRASS